jgi:hypothetical protein
MAWSGVHQPHESHGLGLTALSILHEWSQAADDAGCRCHAEPDPAEPSPRRLPPREKGLHRACCDVADLLVEVNSWLTQWPAAMAALAVAAEGAHLHEGILKFSAELPKHVSSMFTFEAIRGHGMGSLAAFNNDGEGCNPQEALRSSFPSSARLERWSRLCLRICLRFSDSDFILVLSPCWHIYLFIVRAYFIIFCSCIFYCLFPHA